VGELEAALAPVARVGEGAALVAKGPLARAESSWSVRATSSLPVPVSPWMRTGAGVTAACSMSRWTSCMGALRPMSRPRPHTSFTRRRRIVISSRVRPRSIAFSISSRNRSRSTGLVR
jgi:hypothetical protein